MTDQSEAIVYDAVRKFRAMIAAQQAHIRAYENGLVGKPQTNARLASEFSVQMNLCARQIMGAYPEFSPDEWEAFVDLMPEVRHVLEQTRAK